MSRAAVLTNSLGQESVVTLVRQDCRADASRPAPGGGSGTLHVTDARTGKAYEIPVSEGGTIRGTDVGKIKAGGDGVGLRMYDPGYINTAAVVSRICFIDGAKGILRYRGYPIEQIALKSNFLDVAHCLLYGELPSKGQATKWHESVMREARLPQAVVNAMEALPDNAHPMSVVMTGVTALGSLHPEQNPALAGQSIYNSQAVQDAQVVRLLGAIPTIAAYSYYRRLGRRPAAPSERLGYADNFLYMLDSMGSTSYRPHPVLGRALDVLFTLHAEHEMNCSTAAVRHLASSGVDVYTAVTGGIGALYGPLHGGANEAVIKMLIRLKSPDNIPAFLEAVKDKKEKLFGFGHRVYKNFDPRAKLIQQLATDVFAVTGKDPLIDLAVKLLEAARADDYFVSRKLYPNVDFFSGLVYRAMGFDPSFFTVLFAVPRVAGYLAHWRESLRDPDGRIARPQQDYRGVWLRDFPADIARPAVQGPEGLVQSNEHKRKVAGEAWI
eukprot:jgi/Ulvmu1/5393/UM022_0188.1